MIRFPFRRKAARQKTSYAPPYLLSAAGPLTSRTQYVNPLANLEPSYTLTMTVVRPGGPSWLGGTNPVLFEVGNTWSANNSTNCYVGADGKIDIFTIDGGGGVWEGVVTTPLSDGTHTLAIQIVGRTMNVKVDGVLQTMSYGGAGTGFIATQGTQLWLAGGGSNVAGNVTVTNATVRRP